MAAPSYWWLVDPTTHGAMPAWNKHCAFDSGQRLRAAKTVRPGFASLNAQQVAIAPTVYSLSSSANPSELLSQLRQFGWLQRSNRQPASSSTLHRSPSARPIWRTPEIRTDDSVERQSRTARLIKPVCGNGPITVQLLTVLGGQAREPKQVSCRT